MRASVVSMRVTLVFFAVLAAVAAVPTPPTPIKLASKPITARDAPVVASNLFTGTFFTRQDHTRPQNRVLALFVSFSQNFLL